MKGESVRRELSTIRHIFKVALERWGYIQSPPMVGLQQPKASKPRTQRFTQEDIDEIVNISGYNESLKTAKARTGAALLFAIETAMRAGEICGLTWDNVSIGRKTAYLPMTKNGSSRTAPLSKKRSKNNCSNTALSSAESAAKSSVFLASNKLLPYSSQSRVANVLVNRLGS